MDRGSRDQAKSCDASGVNRGNGASRATKHGNNPAPPDESRFQAHPTARAAHLFAGTSGSSVVSGAAAQRALPAGQGQTAQRVSSTGDTCTRCTSFSTLQPPLPGSRQSARPGTEPHPNATGRFARERNRPRVVKEVAGGKRCRPFTDCFRRSSRDGFFNKPRLWTDMPCATAKPDSDTECAKPCQRFR